MNTGWTYLCSIKTEDLQTFCKVWNGMHGDGERRLKFCPDQDVPQVTEIHVWPGGEVWQYGHIHEMKHSVMDLCNVLKIDHSLGVMNE